MQHLTWSIAIASMVLCVACNSDGVIERHVAFDAEAILAEREGKDEMFRESSISPIPHDARPRFDGLRYYAPNQDFVVLATIERIRGNDTFLLPTTQSDDVRAAVREATLRFTVAGTPCSITAYRFVTNETNEWFAAFTDSTTGVETYSVGRYLELENAGNTEQLVIDFNKAYNPYCAYNSDYSCPRVPPENRLPVAIRAGERTWK